MKISEQWLREWVSPEITTDELVKQLSMVGLEVDAVEPVATPLEKVVVGLVLKAEQHPDADRLSVCQVDVGEGEPLTIVCGAKNVAAGQKVPVAVIGGKIGELKIKRTKLRGVASEGMICSATELGLAETSDGIMVLPEDAPVGEAIVDYLKLDDQQIDLDLTPNRGDCLSIAGIAREAAAVNRLPIQKTICQPVSPIINDEQAITVTAPKACPRYAGRVIKGIDGSVTSPLWLTEKLRRSGIRSVSPVVDVTNYVMLELGQPLHAFDLQKLNGALQVRFTQPDEKLVLLDEQHVDLGINTLVIADEHKPLAIAGVMGGADSGVTENTTNIFLEAAHFTPQAMAGVARRYGLHTDSSHRFERGVDPQLPEQALERATELLLAIVGGQPGPITTVSSEAHLPKPATIALRHASVTRLLGLDLAKEKVADLLEALQFSLKETKEGWQVVAPSYRFDIQQEADLIEEIARLYGYDTIPAVKPQGQLGTAEHAGLHVNKHYLAQSLVDRGYQEVITYSFTDAASQQAFTPNQKPVALMNPLSDDLGYMRTSLWPGLVNVLQYNEHRQQSRLRLFEMGRCFWGYAPEEQVNMLAGLATGSAYPTEWDSTNRAVDFYDVKADIEALLSTLFTRDNIEFIAHEHPALHPGQTAQIQIAGKALGWLGMLHPKLQQQLKLKQAVYLFELQQQRLDEAQLPKFQPLSKFPSVRRDLALVMAEHISAGEIIQEIRRIIGNLLQHVEVFDVYRGAGIAENEKSLALGITLQHPERTLRDEEIEATIEKLLTHLTHMYQVRLRES